MIRRQREVMHPMDERSRQRFTGFLRSMRLEAEARLYDRLFNEENPCGDKEIDYKSPFKILIRLRSSPVTLSLRWVMQNPGTGISLKDWVIFVLIVIRQRKNPYSTGP